MTLRLRLGAVVSARARLELGLRLIEQGAGARGVQLLARAARQDCLDAHYHLGRCYLEGRAVPASRVEAMRWLERAAQGGHARGQFLLAALYAQGVAQAGPAGSPVEGLFSANEGGAPDYAAALPWARQAAEQGVAEAQSLLGTILVSGPEALRDPEEAEQWYRRSAAAGCPQGSLGLGLALLRKGDPVSLGEAAVEIRKAAAANLDTAIYLLGTLAELVENDSAQAAELYRQAAEKGVREAQLRWGTALLEGRGVARDTEAAESWLRRAAQAGDVEAAALVGNLCAQGGQRPPNYVEAAIWLERAAEQGHAPAARRLGQLHATGALGAADPVTAADWLERAAGMGDRPAQAELGNLVLSGGAVSEMLRVGEWFERRADAGDPVAAFNFAVCLTSGVGVARDERKAAAWLRRAAERLPVAQYWYGRALCEGRGLDADLAAARVWLGRAAASGNTEAQVALAEMMVNARGGPPDRKEAGVLFAKAAAQGHPGAMFALGVLAHGHDGGGADHAAAARWFGEAAERGHPNAQLMLARYLARGLAGTLDLAQARRLLQAAQAAGIAEARLELERLARADDVGSSTSGASGSPKPESDRHALASAATRDSRRDVSLESICQLGLEAGWVLDHTS